VLEDWEVDMLGDLLMQDMYLLINNAGATEELMAAGFFQTTKMATIVLNGLETALV